MQVLVTGVAGFIGSHMAERLLADGHTVVGVDCFTDYYAREVKERNLSAPAAHANFTFVEGDLMTLDLTGLVRNVQGIVHLAGQPGVRSGWGESFLTYNERNVYVTQRLLEASRDTQLHRFVYASSSSVYGDVPLPFHEDAYLQPASPYGVTKLAAEHLCSLYHANMGIPTVSLRYFTVYGPRQRPEMAISQFIDRMLRDEELVVYGDGTQRRDFTYVTDVVAATTQACYDGPPGGIYNIAGGTFVSVRELLDLCEDLVGKPARVRYEARGQGEMTHTNADTTRARADLGYAPRVTLRDGLRAQIAWLKDASPVAS